MGRVQDRVAIVTGAASQIGLGYATAAGLLREGAKVVITDIDEERIRSAAEALSDDTRVAWFKQDVGDEGDWDQVLEATVDRFGRLDIMVNNAGVGAPAGMDVITLEFWDRIIRVNLTGTFLGSRAAMRQMRSQKSGGSIVNISSMYGGVVGFPNLPAYTASKGGVRSLSKTIALEGAEEGIRCNVIHPGVIRTEMLPIETAPDIMEAARVGIPTKKIGKPEDIGNAVLFLASDESSYITGTEIIVDAGWTAQ